MIAWTPKKLFLTTFIGFLVVHAASFLTFGRSELMREIIFLFIIAAAFIAGLKDARFLLAFVVVDLFVDSNGTLFELRDVSLRLALLALLFLGYGMRVIKQKGVQRPTLVLILFFCSLGAFGALNGLLNAHEPLLIFGDTIPFLFFLLLYPLYDYFSSHSEEHITRMLFWLTLGAAWAACLGAVLTFALYSSETAALQAPYYDWIRNWLAGKVTFMGDNFYRIVTPFFLPLSVLTPWMFMRGASINASKKLNFLLLAPLFILPALHLSRGLLLGMAAGFVSLFFFYSYKTVIRSGLIFLLGFFVSFSLLYGIASGGKSIGFEHLIGRGKAVVKTGIEESADTRRLLLPPLITSFLSAPVWGHGFGLTLAYENSFLGKTVVTPHLDWGYLELLNEVGLVGLAIFIGFMVWVVLRIKSAPRLTGALATSALAVLAVTELVMQSFIHVYGLVMFALLAGLLLAYGTTIYRGSSS